MPKSILVIATSPRRQGNSESVVDAFIKGAKEVGQQVEKICLYEHSLHFCQGCLACTKTHQCILSDDAQAIINKMAQADVLAFATPIYFYEMCGQMKTLLDRSNPLFNTEYKFRDIYLFTSAADEETTTPQNAIAGLQGWIDCFPKARLAGNIFVGGVEKVGDSKDHPALQEAYLLGKNI